MRIMNTTFNVEGSEFKLHTLLDLDIIQYADEIEDITDGADKQLAIEHKLADIKELFGGVLFLVLQRFQELYGNVYKWYTETSGLGLAQQAQKLMEPQAAKSEAQYPHPCPLTTP